MQGFLSIQTSPGPSKKSTNPPLFQDKMRLNGLPQVATCREAQLSIHPRRWSFAAGGSLPVHIPLLFILSLKCDCSGVFRVEEAVIAMAKTVRRSLNCKHTAFASSGKACQFYSPTLVLLNDIFPTKIAEWHLCMRYKGGMKPPFNSSDFSKIDYGGSRCSFENRQFKDYATAISRNLFVIFQMFRAHQQESGNNELLWMKFSFKFCRMPFYLVPVYFEILIFDLIYLDSLSKFNHFQTPQVLI